MIRLCLMLGVLLTPTIAQASCLMTSWYGPGFDRKKTASGETFHSSKVTVAHKSIPFGTKVKFTNPQNGKTVIAKVNDRGPFIKGRSFDLSKAAAQQVGIIQKGHACLRVQVLK